MSRLKVIDGGGEELERKKCLLFSQPWVFSAEEFEEVCKLLKLSRAEEFDLLLMRVSHKAKHGSREATAILSLFNGDDKTAKKILDRERRKRLLRPVTSEPEVPPRSA